MDRKNLNKYPEVKVGSLICIKRIWILSPISHAFGIVLEVRKTKWDKNYRIIKMLKIDGEISEEPLNIIRDIDNLEILA